MTQQKEAMKLAAQYISWTAFGECRVFGDGPPPTAKETVDALTAVLALPDAQPVAWQWDVLEGSPQFRFKGKHRGVYFEDPVSLGIQIPHPSYKWTPLFATPQPVIAPATLKVTTWLDDDGDDSPGKVIEVHGTETHLRILAELLVNLHRQIELVIAPTWVRLTDADITEIIGRSKNVEANNMLPYSFAGEIEAAFIAKQGGAA